MTTRLDLAIQKHPDCEEAIRLLASRDPSGNLKYLHWSVSVLVSGQALAPEIADVVDRFHKYAGFAYGPRRREQIIRRDIYSYRPQDLAHLRDALSKVERAQNKKRKARERLYKIEGAMDADVVWQSDSLVVRHIRNKQASVHYGLNTKWCIAMNREGYFDDYESHNATFFFFERKKPVGDEYDKSALMFSRDPDGSTREATCFTSLDGQVSVFSLIKAYGHEVFEILRTVYERSESYPGSVASCVLAGKATAEQLGQFVACSERNLSTDAAMFIEAVCCNDAAPWSLLQGILESGERTIEAARKKRGKKRGADVAKRTMRAVRAALSVHPNVPADVREQLTKILRKGHVDVSTIRVGMLRYTAVGVAFEMVGTRLRYSHGHFRHGRRRYRRSRHTVTQITRRLAYFTNAAKRTKKQLRKAKLACKRKVKAKAKRARRR